MRRILGAIAVLLGTAALAACDGDDDPWPAAGDPVGIEGIIWVQGTTVGDATGPQFEVSPAPHAFVVAGDGIYYGGGDDGHLFHATAQGTSDLGAVGSPRTLRASPDRRWIAFIDFADNQTDRDAAAAEAVVVDTRTGREALRTRRGMGGPDDDFAVLYGELPPEIHRVTDETVWFEGPDGVVEYRLRSGDLIDHDEREYKFRRPPWDDRAPGRGLWNESRTWYIVGTTTGSVIKQKEGPRVRPHLDGEHRILGWVDDDTVYGRSRQHLVTCDAPGFSCVQVPGAEGALLLPNGMNWSSRPIGR